MAKPLPQVYRICPSPPFEKRALQVLNTHGQSVLGALKRPVRALVLQNYRQRLWDHYTQPSSFCLTRCCVTSEKWYMTGCTLLGHFICNVKCMSLKSPQNKMVKSNLIISKFSDKKETVEMDELSQSVSVEMKPISEKRLFINLFLSSSVKAGFDRKCSVFFFFLSKGKWKRQIYGALTVVSVG